MSTVPSQTSRPAHELGCTRHPWCVRETVTLAQDGTPARFHHGVPTTIQAGDDQVTVAPVATDDTGEMTYVEIEVATGRRDETVSAWLTNEETGVLAASLTSAQQA